jgi:tRNA dimethylallyltransferase
MITVLGPTATGKTKLAASIAYWKKGEIISADSRQVYRGMDIGTGKDLEDYYLHNTYIPYHLIDIMEPGGEYNVYGFQQDFLNAYQKIVSKGKTPVLCGGTGMYIESVLNGYRLQKVPENSGLRQELLSKPDEDLREMLLELRPNQHNNSDLSDRKRLIRAIEIARYDQEHPAKDKHFPKIENISFGIYFERPVLRERITQRLKERLKSGMIEEMHYLLSRDITPDQLRFYGLEYRFLTDYLTGQINYDEMFSGLNTAIHQFAKRQVTWFRRMERKGHIIHWIDGQLPLNEKLDEVETILANLNKKPEQ